MTLKVEIEYITSITVEVDEQFTEDAMRAAGNFLFEDKDLVERMVMFYGYKVFSENGEVVDYRRDGDFCDEMENEIFHRNRMMEDHGMMSGNFTHVVPGLFYPEEEDDAEGPEKALRRISDREDSLYDEAWRWDDEEEEALIERIKRDECVSCD